MTNLSVIIPSYKDPLLKKTIESLLVNAETDIEVIAVLDGYWLKPEYIVQDKRVNYLHLGRNRGMRGAINAGISISKGKYIMRTDEHCMFAKGYDRILTETCKDNWIVTARRYFLDPVKWEVMDIPPVDYEKLALRDDGKVRKFEGQRWHSRDKKRKDIMIDETMAMQGSMWVMRRSWWDKVIKELQTKGYGPHIQDSTEMIFKTWKAGGKMMLNKNTWFAHKHVSFPRTHNGGSSENRANESSGWAYALKVWEDYYKKEIKPKWKL